MENQLNNIRACWNMATQWESWLRDYDDACEAEGKLTDPVKYEELRSEVNNYYDRYRSMADAFCREYGGAITAGQWSSYHLLAA